MPPWFRDIAIRRIEVGSLEVKMNEHQIDDENVPVESADLQEQSAQPTDWDIRHWSELLGKTVLGMGIGVLMLTVLDRLAMVPFRLPDFWFPVRSLWWIIGVVGVVAGVKILQDNPRLHGWRPDRPGRRFRTLILYTREGCHLCDDAQELLQAYGRYLPPISEVDIDKDAILIAKFTTCVPVVEIDGKIRFRGHVDESLLRRLIEGSRPSR